MQFGSKGREYGVDYNAINKLLQLLCKSASAPFATLRNGPIRRTAAGHGAVCLLKASTHMHLNARHAHMHVNTYKLPRLWPELPAGMRQRKILQAAWLGKAKSAGGWRWAREAMENDMAWLLLGSRNRYKSRP